MSDKEVAKVVVVYADGTEMVLGEGDQSVVVVAAQWEGGLIGVRECGVVGVCACPICQMLRNALADKLLAASERVLAVGHEDDEGDEGGDGGGGCTGCDLCGMPGQPDGEHVYRGRN